MFINGSSSPYNSYSAHIFDILESDVDDKYFLSVPTCEGILRRSKERNLKMNKRVALLMKSAVNRSKSTDKQSNDLLVRIGVNIRNIRKINNIAQKQLASEIGISERYFINVEKGKENVSVLILDKIANALGVEIKEIVK